MNLTKAKETKTRVCCLYRVSTKGQVDKAENDIPMQKKACHEFAESKGWTIIKEHAELGVSGFKVAAADRDELQEIKREAEKHEFDILLVFMDIDYLRRINNDFGRAAGDEVIVAAARCIENVFGAIGKCYRTGGDEFAVVVFDPEEDRNALSEKLDKEIRRYNRNSRYRMSISRGFSSIRDDRGKLKTTGEWKYEADTNMYQNKMKERKTHEL